MVGSMCNVVYWIIVIHSMCWNDRTWHTSLVLHHNVPSLICQKSYVTMILHFTTAILCWRHYLVPLPKHTKKCSCRRRILSAKILASNKSAFSRAPNDSFLLHMLKTLSEGMKSTFRYLEMKSMRRYEICVCLVILEDHYLDAI